MNLTKSSFKPARSVINTPNYPVQSWSAWSIGEFPVPDMADERESCGWCGEPVDCFGICDCAGSAMLGKHRCALLMKQEN